MSESTENEKAGGWRGLWRRPRGKLLLGIPVGGFLMFLTGIIFWGGFNTALEATNTEAFCISCHEMRDNVYQEYKKTMHYKNPAGVRAICPDCHVPRDWVHKVARKIRASNELFHKIIGSVGTREQFEAHRLRLAKNVWATMKATDSRECRNCHALASMDLEEQDKRARRKHTLKWKKEHGDTCIDCHKGITHKLPKLTE